MTTAPEDLIAPYEALQIIKVFVIVVGEAENPEVAGMTLREIWKVLDNALLKKPSRGRKA